MQVSSIQQELQQVQISLKSAPELTGVPSTVKTLQDSIGRLGVNITDLKYNFDILKSSVQQLKNSQNEQRKNLTAMKVNYN